MRSNEYIFITINDWNCSKCVYYKCKYDTVSSDEILD